MKKFILCVAIMFIMISCLFSTGCISNENNSSTVGISTPLNNIVNQSKYSIEDIEKLVEENSANYDILVGEHSPLYQLNQHKLFCSVKSNGHIYGYDVKGDFSNYNLKEDMLILSQEKSLYVVKDETLANRFISIRFKGDNPEDSFATILYCTTETFDDICSLLYK